MIKLMLPAQFVTTHPERFPTTDQYDNTISADEFRECDGHVEIIDETHFIYVPATHAGYTKDGTRNANPVRMYL